MKILIAYASKNGSTRECAERLKSALNGMDVTLVDLQRETPRAEEYDLCVVGGSVRFGRLLKPVRVFLKEQESILCERPLALFFCCGLAHEVEYYRDVLFSKELRRACFELIYFGGSLRTDGLSFRDKLLVRSLRSAIAESDIDDGEYTPSMPGILPENVEKLAANIRENFRKSRS